MNSIAAVKNAGEIGEVQQLYGDTDVIELKCICQVGITCDKD